MRHQLARFKQQFIEFIEEQKEKKIASARIMCIRWKYKM